MNNYCHNCGTEIDGSSNFCPLCGAQTNNSLKEANENNTNYTGEPIPFVPYRSLLTAVIFSFLTCGLYQLYWFIVMTDEISKISDDHNTTGIKAFLFSLLTCGIYTFYWYYKMGKNLYIAGQKYNKNLSDNSILYLVLGIFGFGIVSYCLMQSDLNKFSNQQ